MTDEELIASLPEAERDALPIVNDDRFRYAIVVVLGLLLTGWLIWANGESSRCEARGGQPVYDRSYRVICATEPPEPTP